MSDNKTFAMMDDEIKAAEAANKKHHNGTHYLHIWSAPVGEIGSVISHRELQYHKWLYGDNYSIHYFYGTHATIVTVQDIRYVDRERALWFATKYAKGEMNIIHVDLNLLTSVTVSGVDLTVHPRQ